MIILQITNLVCASAEVNQLSGVYRVVTQLSQFYVRQCGDVCFNGFLMDNHLKRADCFSKGILLDTPCFSIFSSFLKENSVDIVQINLFAYPEYIQHISKICDICHSNGVKVIQCFHYMPGYEGISHGSWEEICYRLSAKKKVFDKLKKYLITLFQPLSSRIVLSLLKQKYLVPYQCTDKIVLFSEPYVDRYLQIIHQKDRNKFAIIPNPLSFCDILPEDEVSNKRKEVIIVGRPQEAQKRVSYALKIWKLVERHPSLNDWQLTIVGEGYDEGFYRWLAKKYQLNRISFEGHQDPRPYYKQAAVLMYTSSYEGWPMVFMEAMPMGCCCMAFDSYDAVRDMIRDGHDGCIISENDIQGYYKRLAHIMLNDEERIQIGKNAIRSSARFSMDLIGKEWRDLFESIAG